MNPKVRQSVYLIGTIISGVVGVALIWGGIDAGSASNIEAIISGIGALIGGGASATAARTVKEQRNAGTFDSTSPIDAVINNIPVIFETASKAQADVDRLRGAAFDAIGDLPVYGKDAQNAIDKFLGR